MKTVKLPQEDFNKLQSLYPSMHQVIQHLDGVVHPKIIDQLNQVKQTMEGVFEPFWQEERAQEDNNYDELRAVQKKYGMIAVWSIAKIGAKSLSRKMGVVKQITYEGQKHQVSAKGKNISWLQAWQVADSLIRCSGRSNHIFVEGFHELTPGCWELQTGS